MAEVVFVTPNFGGLVREEPVGTLLLATILKDAGVQADILQFHHFGDVKNFDAFIDCAISKIFEKNPKIVSFYTRCDTYHISLTIAERIKQAREDLAVVFAGPQADLSCEDTLRQIPYVDFICCGEGETTIVPFFRSLIAGKPDLSVRGLAYRADGGIVKNPRPELIADLDTLPTIDYSLLAFNNEGNESKVKYLFPVDVGRGCPFACTYCSTKNFWGRKYRLKSAERIIDEIKEIYKRFGVTSFNFEHDMFTMNREKVIRICGMLKEIGFPIRWRCSARMDCLDNALVDIMADAGMEMLFVGIETGSPRMQKLIHKNLKLDDIYDKLKYISEKGVNVTASFMFGFPEETEEDFSQTIELMMKISRLPHIIVQHHLCAFLCGTELTEKYGHHSLRLPVVSDISGEVAVQECEKLISEHPSLFPHFYEYKTEFRDKVKYYPQFFACWQTRRPIYQYIADQYYKGHLCDMLFAYTAANLEALEAGADRLTMIEQDQFLQTFTEDENYDTLKEVERFLLWNRKMENGSTEVFGFDVDALLKGGEITALRNLLCVVTYTERENGEGSYTCRRILR